MQGYHGPYAYRLRGTVCKEGRQRLRARGYHLLPRGPVPALLIPAAEGTGQEVRIPPLSPAIRRKMGLSALSDELSPAPDQLRPGPRASGATYSGERMPAVPHRGG